MSPLLVCVMCSMMVGRCGSEVNQGSKMLRGKKVRVGDGCCWAESAHALCHFNAFCTTMNAAIECSSSSAETLSIHQAITSPLNASHCFQICFRILRKKNEVSNSLYIFKLALFALGKMNGHTPPLVPQSPWQGIELCILSCFNSLLDRQVSWQFYPLPI